MKRIIGILFVTFILLWGCTESLVYDGEEPTVYDEATTAQDKELYFKRGRRTCKHVRNAKVKATSGRMEIEILPSNSDFVNHIYLVSPGAATFLATDDDTGMVIPLPPTRRNQELIFEIRVNDSTPIWQTGPGRRNSDGRRHAQVIRCGRQYEVQFEDIDASGWGVADEPNFVDAIFTVRPR